MELLTTEVWAGVVAAIVTLILGGLFLVIQRKKIGQAIGRLSWARLSRSGEAEFTFENPSEFNRVEHEFSVGVLGTTRTSSHEGDKGAAHDALTRATGEAMKLLREGMLVARDNPDLAAMIAARMVYAEVLVASRELRIRKGENSSEEPLDPATFDDALQDLQRSSILTPYAIVRLQRIRTISDGIYSGGHIASGSVSQLMMFSLRVVAALRSERIRRRQK